MRHLMKHKSFPLRIPCLGLALVTLALLTGCEEVNMAIDNILGRRSPVVLAAASHQSQLSTILAKKRRAGDPPPAPAPEATPSQPQRPAKQVAPAPGKVPGKPVAKRPQTPLHRLKGKKRAVGAMPPRPKQPGVPLPQVAEVPETVFRVSRDPFKAPTEILPTECPPSTPLCKFDRSQLKLVGVIQVENGQFKGMVEDPDGRGYFVTTGMQIGGATVTQVTRRGITLHLRKTGQDVVLPLFEAREAKEF